MEAGLDPDRFWSLTPKQVEREMAAAVSVRQRQMQDVLWQSWHVAVFTRMEKLPPLSQILRQPENRRSPARPKDWREMAAAAQAWSIRQNGQN